MTSQIEVVIKKIRLILNQSNLDSIDSNQELPNSELVITLDRSTEKSGNKKATRRWLLINLV